MRQTLTAVALVLLVATAGCGAFGGDSGDSETPDGNVTLGLDDAAANATGVNQTVRVSVGEAAADSEWESLAVTYPRDRFEVESAQHDEVSLGVDTDDDSEVEEAFDESNVSGVNHNEYSFAVELDTGYALDAGDVVVVEYPAVDTPDEPGNYSVEVGLNDAQTVNGTVQIGE